MHPTMFSQPGHLTMTNQRCCVWSQMRTTRSGTMSPKSHLRAKWGVQGVRPHAAPRAPGLLVEGVWSRVSQLQTLALGGLEFIGA